MSTDYALITIYGMTKTKSTFTIVQYTDQKVFIVDCDIGMSVTNDAENVCKFIQDCYPDRRIIYRDTQGQWDELVHKHGTFQGFKPYSEWHPKDEEFTTV